MTAVLELLITVILVGGGLYALYWALGLLKGKLPEPIHVATIVVFVVLAIVVFYHVGFNGWRILKL